MTGQRLVVGPQRHSKAATHVHERIHVRFHHADRATRGGEPLGAIHFDLCTRFVRVSDDVTRCQPQRQLVRVVENDRLGGSQVK